MASVLSIYVTHSVMVKDKIKTGTQSHLMPLSIHQ